MKFMSLIACLAICVVLNQRSDPFTPGGKARVIAFWDAVVMEKSNDLSFDYSAKYPGPSNQAKRNYRIIPPLIAKFTGIENLRAVEFASFCLLAACIYASLVPISRRVAFAGTIASICTASGACYFSDWGHGCDMMAHAFMAVNLVSAAPVVAAITTTLALFTDERAVLMIPAFILFGRRDWAPYGIGFAAYLVGRLALSRMYVPTNYADVASADIVISNLRLLPMVIWASLEGGWIILIAYRKWLPAIYCVSIGLASVVVLDMTKSAAYALLVPAICIMAMRDKFSERTLFFICLAAATISVAIPNSYFISGFLEEWF